MIRTFGLAFVGAPALTGLTGHAGGPRVRYGVNIARTGAMLVVVVPSPN